MNEVIIQQNLNNSRTEEEIGSIYGGASEVLVGEDGAHDLMMMSARALRNHAAVMNAAPSTIILWGRE